MKRNVWEARIPTLFALGILLLSIGVTTLMVQSGIITIGQASPDKQIENLKVTNVADNSFSIAFTTRAKTEAFASIGTEKPSSVEYDDRDKVTKSPASYYAHQITFSNLLPNTKYFYTITVDGVENLDNNQPYTFTTPNILSAQSTQQPTINGSVIDNESVADDALVLLTIENAQILSTVTKPSGEYSIIIKNLRSIDLSSQFAFNSLTNVNLSLIKQGKETIINTIISKSTNIPLVTLSKNYDFTTEVPVVSDNQDSESSLDIPLASPASTQEVKLLTPKQDSALIDQKPQFRGTAPPGTKVKITIQSTIQQGEATADNNGLWTFRPSQALLPGNHTVTIEAQDANGIIKRFTQKFSVYAQGSQITQTATPSATPTISTTITQSPIVTITSTPSLTPIITRIVTPSPTPLPAMIPIKNIQSPGELSLSVAISLLSSLFIITGVLLLAF